MSSFRGFFPITTEPVINLKREKKKHSQLEHKTWDNVFDYASLPCTYQSEESCDISQSFLNQLIASYVAEDQKGTRQGLVEWLRW
jgi:hypothetical protein